MKRPYYYINAIKSRIAIKSAERKDASVNHHAVIIESDDWGSIRMPARVTLEELKAKNYSFFDGIGYDRYDTLANNEDLESLIDTLSSVKDADGHPAKFTMNCVIANPDFAKIRQTGFREYHYELFTETLKRYPHHDRSFSLWLEGLKEGVFKPQFHGREHLNAQMWLHLLQKNCLPVRDCFEKGVFSVQVDETVDARRHSLAAYNISKESEYEFVEKSIVEGLDIFEKLFGYRSESMIAPNYTWDRQIEETAFSCGVKYLQGSRNQRHSYYVMQNEGRTEVRYTGQRNPIGQIYMVRNCSFEPSENPKKNADFCLAQIQQIFNQGHVAIISSHRQNYIGDLYPQNRTENLRQLKDLLTTLVKQYPDVVFLSSDELGHMLDN